MSLFLSRFVLSAEPSLTALSALIDPGGQGERLDAHHRLIWSAFAGEPDAPRDFLWRSEGRGRFLVLSARAPGGSPLFEPIDSKPFAPDLRAGDELLFQLRANATRTERTGEFSAGGKEKKRHVDLVMDRLHSVPPGQRAAKRMDLAREVAGQWMVGQGARAGFEPAEVLLADYATVALPQGKGKRRGRPHFGVLDLTGRLRVTDPAVFVPALGRGFGRGKAFGCGLMLIRRAG